MEQRQKSNNGSRIFAINRNRRKETSLIKKGGIFAMKSEEAIRSLQSMAIERGKEDEENRQDKSSGGYLNFTEK